MSSCHHLRGGPLDFFTLLRCHSCSVSSTYCPSFLIYVRPILAFVSVCILWCQLSLLFSWSLSIVSYLGALDLTFSCPFLSIPLHCSQWGWTGKPAMKHNLMCLSWDDCIRVLPSFGVILLPTEKLKRNQGSHQYHRWTVENTWTGSAAFLRLDPQPNASQ